MQNPEDSQVTHNHPPALFGVFPVRELSRIGKSSAALLHISARPSLASPTGPQKRNLALGMGCQHCTEGKRREGREEALESDFLPLPGAYQSPVRWGAGPALGPLPQKRIPVRGQFSTAAGSAPRTGRLPCSAFFFFFGPTLPTPSPGPGEIPALTSLADARPGRKRAPRPGCACALRHPHCVCR